MSNPNLDTTNQDLNPQEREFENSIRPADMDAFTGQPQLIENISIFINRKLGLEAGLREIWTGSGTSRLDIHSSGSKKLSSFHL